MQSKISLCGTFCERVHLTSMSALLEVTKMRYIIGFFFPNLNLTSYAVVEN